MIDGNKWQIKRQCKRFGKRNPNNKRAQQAWPLRKGNTINAFFFYVGHLQRLLYSWYNILLVRPRRQLWDYAAKFFVNCLVGNNIGRNFAVIANGNWCFVARRFYSKYNWQLYLFLSIQNYQKTIKNTALGCRIATGSVAWFYIFATIWPSANVYCAKSGRLFI